MVKPFHLLDWIADDLMNFEPFAAKVSSPFWMVFATGISRFFLTSLPLNPEKVSQNCHPAFPAFFFGMILSGKDVLRFQARRKTLRCGMVAPRAYKSEASSG